MLFFGLDTALSTNLSVNLPILIPDAGFDPGGGTGAANLTLFLKCDEMTDVMPMQEDPLPDSGTAALTISVDDCANAILWTETDKFTQKTYSLSMDDIRQRAVDTDTASLVEDFDLLQDCHSRVTATVASALARFEATNTDFVASHTTLLSRLKADKGTGGVETKGARTFMTHVDPDSNIAIRTPVSTGRVPLYKALRVLYAANVPIIEEYDDVRLETAHTPAQFSERGAGLLTAIETVAKATHR